MDTMESLEAGLATPDGTAHTGSPIWGTQPSMIAQRGMPMRNPTGMSIYLQDDDSLLRKVFFSVLRHHHPNLAVKVDEIFHLSEKWCQTETEEDLQEMDNYLKALKPDESILVASAFSHMLNLHNLTEDVSRSIDEKNVRLGEVVNSVNSTNRSMINLAKSGVPPQAMYDALCNQTVDLVITAHPTQALRGSLLKKYAVVRKELNRMHNERLSKYEKIECLENIRAFVQGAWRTDEIRRTKPTPQDEMRSGMQYFQNVVTNMVPIFHRRIDTALANLGLPKLPLDHALFRFGSWMGGDRDGNPNVTWETTRDVVIISRLEAVNSYFGAVEALMFDLSIWRCSPELKEYAGELASKESHDAVRVAEERKKRNYMDFWTPIPTTEPYRLVLGNMRDKLYVTREVLHSCLMNSRLSVLSALEDEGAYTHFDQLFNPLKLLYDSMISTGDASMANSRLLDLLRKVRTFGMGMMPLDIRQESTRHMEVIDAITTFLGIGSYASWDEPKRVAFLEGELKGRRPLMPPGMPMSPDVAEVVATCRILANIPPDSLGAYVISMAHTASDVLAVVLLQRECGVKEFLRVAPLFETLDDLNNAPATMRTLLSNEWYHAHIKGKQECMIGYSDSGKDAGRLAAAWGLFETQDKLARVAAEFNVQLVLFHGRGGSVGRGGGPTHTAIRGQPAGSINGQLRVTVQGEIIEQQFGEREVAFRTLDLYTSAVMEHSLQPPLAPKPEWCAVMARLSATSCAVYRKVVFQTPNFYQYFAEATPVGELGNLNIGSRPSSRKSGGIESLRAIPWIFAWTQTRSNLPVWLGIGEALKECIDDGGQLDVLQDMYANWPFFNGMMDLVEMVLAKSDPAISRLYDRTLATPELWVLGEELRDRLAETKKQVLRVIHTTVLLENGGPANLDEKLRLRNPYVAPLNVLQVHALQALREFRENKRSVEDYAPSDPETLDLLSRDPLKDPTQHPIISATQDCLLITIKGIAAGMQNTG